MEKKRMTKAEAVELLNNRKVYVNGKSAEIQKKLFELGFKWQGQGLARVVNEGSLFIFIDKNMRLGYSCSMIFFKAIQMPEISAEEILSIEVVEELKENDVIVYGWGEGENMAEWISVVRDGKSNLRIDKVSLLLKSAYANTDELQYVVVCEIPDWIRNPTEEEKQKLVDALKVSTDDQAKTILKEVFGIEECPFKPFDRVLVRDTDKLPWVARFFDRMYEGDYGCTDSLCYKQCLPYESNEHLHNTTKNPEERS